MELTLGILIGIYLSGMAVAWKDIAELYLPEDPWLFLLTVFLWPIIFLSELLDK